MPNWSFRGDWPEEFAPSIPEELRTGSRNDLVVEPVRNDVSRNEISRDRYNLSIEGTVKSLVINIESMVNVPVLAMASGNISYDPILATTTLTTDIFTISGINRIFAQEQAIFSDLLGSQNIYLLRWFQSWVEAGTVPHTIIYENIEDSVCAAGSANVRVGQSIGNAGVHPTDPQKKQIRIKIEYQDSTLDNPKFMHPREFFNLLFWEEDCDPFLADSPREYTSPLLQKMMRLYCDGSDVVIEGGGPVTNISQLSNNNSEFRPLGNADADAWLHNNNVFRDHENIEDWLGLRPPLRIYKRVEWEARVTHKIHHNNWQTAHMIVNPPPQPPICCVEALPYGDLRGVIRNPLVTVGVGIRKESKCNLFVGDISFRSGFRAFVYRTSASRLSYQSRDSYTDQSCNSTNCNNQLIPHASNSGTVSYEGKTYRLSSSKLRGKKRYIPNDDNDSVSQLNQEISDFGKVIIHARKRYSPPASREIAFHVVFVSRIRSVSANSLQADVLDQHLMDTGGGTIPRDCGVPVYCGCGGATDRAFIELIPGGDPSEPWGIVDLNCLEEAPAIP
jgi:hypothetical protein